MLLLAEINRHYLTLLRFIKPTDFSAIYYADRDIKLDILCTMDYAITTH